MTDTTTTPRRDPAGIALGIAFVIIAAALAHAAMGVTAWAWAWWTAATIIGTIGLVGFAADATKKPRPE